LQETDEFNKKYNKSNYVKNRSKQNKLQLNDETDRQQRQKHADLKAKTKLRKEMRMRNQGRLTAEKQ